jgi:hypothetical protein
MIIIESMDKKLWNIESKVIEIIKEATASTDKIIIDFNYEGPCLRSSNFYNILDTISEKFNVDKNRFIIRTLNTEEYHDEYTIEILNNPWLDEATKRNKLNVNKKLIKYNVGCFIGKVNWNRLYFLTWLDSYYKNKSLISCYYDSNNLTQTNNLGIRELAVNFPNEIDLAGKFLKTCPRLLDKSVLPSYQRRPTLEVRHCFEIDAYPQIFAELVCETYYSGLTFFPTEKTFRPIIELTPFVTFGPQGYLANLQRCGFKTFSDFWDESYDTVAGKDRAISITKVLEQILAMSSDDMQQMYADMLPILEYNKSRLLIITQKNLKLG